MVVVDAPSGTYGAFWFLIAPVLARDFKEKWVQVKRGAELDAYVPGAALPHDFGGPVPTDVPAFLEARVSKDAVAPSPFRTPKLQVTAGSVMMGSLVAGSTSSTSSTNATSSGLTSPVESPRRRPFFKSSSRSSSSLSRSRPRSESSPRSLEASAEGSVSPPRARAHSFSEEDDGATDRMLSVGIDCFEYSERSRSDSSVDDMSARISARGGDADAPLMSVRVALVSLDQVLAQDGQEQLSDATRARLADVRALLCKALEPRI